MASSSSKKVIYAAFAGNMLIAITKFGAAAVTGSSAMFSEAIHSVVDTGNQLLLLYGIRRASRPPDDQHPFGYGMELYFWTFVVAIIVFGLGAGVSILEGIDKFRHPVPVTDTFVNYIVLGFATVFEAAAWTVAYLEFRKRKGATGFFRAIRRSKDPTVFTVLFEDTAAMLGLLVAFGGIFLGDLLDLPVLDAAASIVIGVILAVTAILLAYESKGLLIGEGASRAVVAGIREIITKQPGILAINESLTLHFSPEDVLLTLSLDFSDNMSSADVEGAISKMEREIKAAYPEIRRVFIEAQSIAAHKSDIARTSESEDVDPERVS